MRLAAAFAVLALAGCGGGGFSSYVGEVEPKYASALAYDIADFVAQQAKPTSGPISVEAPPDDATIGPELIRSLQGAGFTVSNLSPSHRLSYQVTPVGGDLMLRVGLDKTDAARLYRVGKDFQALGPFAVRVAS